MLVLRYVCEQIITDWIWVKQMYFFIWFILVTGPEFRNIRVGVGHRLDAFSSGVLGIILNLCI